MKTNNERLFNMAFNSVYPLYVQKAEIKGRSKEEVDQIITWLTGYTQESLLEIINSNISFRDFFENAPKLNSNVSLIKGVVCGVRVEDIEDPLMRNIRYLDKLVDELAKGKQLDKILRK